MKIALENYLILNENYWMSKTGMLPKVCFNDDIDTQMYVGSEDSDGYIQWKYVKRNEEVEFSKICRFPLHQDIKEFMSAFYFMNFNGFYNNQGIYIEELNEGLDLLYRLMEYKGNVLMRLGRISPVDLELYVDNITGNVLIYDFENEETSLLCDSLGTLFENMKPYK